MSRIAIVTDSNSGISQKKAEEMGIFVLPMPFLIDGKEYLDGVNLFTDEFYAFLEKDADVSTSQPSPESVMNLWDKVLENHDELVHIPMSSGLSESCNTAKPLSKDYGGKIQVLDNQPISITQRQSVMDALTLLERGMSATEIKNRLEERKLDAGIYISLATLKYLKKGGRITPAAATMGTMLHLRPVLQIQGERLDKFRMTTVTMKQAKAAIIEGLKDDLNGRFKEYADNGEMILSVAHTQNDEKAQEFKKELEDIFHLPVVFVNPLSLSVSCHIGPGSLAAACMRIEK